MSLSRWGRLRHNIVYWHWFEMLYPKKSFLIVHYSLRLD